MKPRTGDSGYQSKLVLAAMVVRPSLFGWVHQERIGLSWWFWSLCYCLEFRLSFYTCNGAYGYRNDKPATIFFKGTSIQDVTQLAEIPA